MRANAEPKSNLCNTAETKPIKQATPINLNMNWKLFRNLFGRSQSQEIQKMKPLILKTTDDKTTQATIDHWKTAGFTYCEVFQGSGGIEYYIAQGRDQINRQNDETNQNAIAQNDVVYGPIIQHMTDAESYAVYILYALCPINAINRIDTTDMPGGRTEDIEAISNKVMRSGAKPTVENLMEMKTSAEGKFEEIKGSFGSNVSPKPIPSQGKYYTIGKAGIVQMEVSELTRVLQLGFKPITLDQAQTGALKKKGNVLIIKGEIIIPGFVL